ncbi:MAG: UbiD family decarboxylase, partial [Rickettsiales bacterium]|nr:UbiD family decarboxylase [Rickettsiales bacterium]
MPYGSLRDFIEALESKGDLIRVKHPVSSVLEMTEIQTRLLSQKGPAVLFESVETENGSSPIPVLVNLFGTVERVAGALNIEPSGLREIGETLAFLRQPEPPSKLKEAIEMLPLLKKAMSMKPKTLKKAPCQQVVLTGDEIDLSALPIQTCWPDEPAPLITWPLVVTQGPSDVKEDGFNLGIYRMQLLGKNKTLMRWLKHRGGAQQFRRWKKEHQTDFPAAAVIGADPATVLAAVTPVPDTLSEYQFSG